MVTKWQQNSCLRFHCTWSYGECWYQPTTLYIIDKNSATYLLGHSGMTKPTWLSDFSIVGLYNDTYYNRTMFMAFNATDGATLVSQQGEGFVLSPDNRRVAIQSTEAPIYDNNLNLIGNAPNCAAGIEWQFSQHGEKLACNRGPISVVDIDSGKTTDLKLTEGYDYSRFRFLPDNEHIVVGGAVAGGQGLYAYDINTGLGEKISTGFLHYDDDHIYEPGYPIYNNILVYADPKLDTSPNCTPKVWDTVSSQSNQSFSLWTMASGLT